MNKATRLLLAGLIFSEIGIAAYITVSREDGLSRDAFTVERDRAPPSESADISPHESFVSGLVSSDANFDSDIAQLLHAVQNSLQRNDLVSAKVLLDAVDPLHEGDEQVLTLKKMLRGREDQAAGAQAVARVDKPSELREPARPKVRPFPRVDHVRGGSVAARERATETSRHFASESAPEIKDLPDESADNVAAGGGADVDTPSSSQQPTPTMASAPARSDLIGTTQLNASSMQAALINPRTIATDQGPKTRAQVRSELARARTDGTLPRFGNPDPAGPGGLPSSIASPTRQFGSE